MSRCIQERDFASLYGYRVSADMLCDAAGFPVRHMGLSDGVQKRCLTVVHMAHDTDHRRSLLQRGGIFLILLQQFLDHVHLHFPLAENIVFHGKIFRVFVGNLLVYRHNLSFQE